MRLPAPIPTKTIRTKRSGADDDERAHSEPLDEMAQRSVVVIGAGMAGTAAAFAAARAGASVVVVHDRVGASALYSGALDREPWDDARPGESAAPRADVRREAELGTFITALGVHRLDGAAPSGGAWIATASGVVRKAAGADSALLDLAPLAGKRIWVADVERDDWDAPLIARTLAASDWAARTGTAFVPAFVRLVRTGHERRIAPYDFAALHDEPVRRAALADALGAALRDGDAWLLGPWLGADPATAPAVRALVRFPLGETTSPMSGAAGARFEAARDRLFAVEGAAVRRGRVTRVSARGARWAVELVADADPRPTELEASAVVLATGGVAAGGISFTWRQPEVVRGFELPFVAPVTLGLDGEALGGGGSLFGPSLETIGLGALERVGIACDDVGRPVGNHAEQSSLFAAGDAVAGRPRTMLDAALAGLTAGNVAARE
jgi:glycerol-3-phosphate dehydrogenase subunit B